MHLDDTIVAIATPAGRGGIGVVRLAGPDAVRIAVSMLRLRHELAPGQARFGELIEPASGERMDEIVATWFAKPHSYTTDDVVEISAHGAPVVLRHIVEEAIKGGARLAEPGEFTMRAFLHGRLDLTQAEAVRDLIESQTLYQAKVAAQQLEGALSKRVAPIKQSQVELIAMVEAGIDFADDDVPVMRWDQLLQRIASVKTPLVELAQSFEFGKVVHEGLTLAIVGRPNVGKSSLFNRLVERERAIVTPIPGTTRDLVSETVAIGGIPVRLVDTAGIRAASDEVEQIGIQKSYEALADADLVLVVLDAASDARDEDKALLQSVEERRYLVVINKSDLASTAHDGLRTSALTGAGIPELRSAILDAVGAHSSDPQQGGFLTNVRHQALVAEAIRALDAASASANNRVPHEMIMLDLYAALRALDSLTGETTTDDILGQIFSTFCIGK